MKVRESLEWEFYTEWESGKIDIVRVVCRAPERTKTWKRIERLLHTEKVIRVGYRLPDYDKQGTPKKSF
jgi:hypothetical protein